MRLRKYRDELQDGHFLTTIRRLTVLQKVPPDSLGWPTLESRRYISRLTQIIYYYHIPAIHLYRHSVQQYPTNETPPPAPCILYRQLYPPVPISKTFFPKSINKWNNFPSNIIESSSIQHFVAAVTQYRTSIIIEHLRIS